MLIAPGNHDDGANQHFDYLKESFYSPDNKNMNTEDTFFNFYSFDLGLGHFINFHPYWMVYQMATKEQYAVLVQALKDDLERAKSRQNKVPWLIVYSHYPIYCSNAYDEKCRTNHVYLKPFTDLFEEYGVHYFIGAHQHSYERDAPTINNQTATFETDNITTQHFIKNSNAPVYIVEGVAGNDYFMAPQPCTPITP